MDTYISREKKEGQKDRGRGSRRGAESLRKKKRKGPRKTRIRKIEEEDEPKD